MIYFAQLPTGSIKIGFSNDVSARMEQLRVHYGAEPALLFAMDGDRNTERVIHSRFASHRLGRTEQFRPAPDLMAFIGRPLLVGVNPDAVEVMRGPNYDGNCVVVKMDRAIVGMAKAIAISRGISVAELLSELAKRPVEQAYARMLRGIE